MLWQILGKEVVFVGKHISSWHRAHFPLELLAPPECVQIVHPHPCYRSRCHQNQPQQRGVRGLKDLIHHVHEGTWCIWVQIAWLAIQTTLPLSWRLFSIHPRVWCEFDDIYLIVILLMALLSTHMHQDPSFFGVSRASTTHGLILSWMCPFCNNSSTFSFNISCSLGLIR